MKSDNLSVFIPSWSDYFTLSQPSLEVSRFANAYTLIVKLFYTITVFAWSLTVWEFISSWSDYFTVSQLSLEVWQFVNVYTLIVKLLYIIAVFVWSFTIFQCLYPHDHITLHYHSFCLQFGNFHTHLVKILYIITAFVWGLTICQCVYSHGHTHWQIYVWPWGYTHCHTHCHTHECIQWSDYFTYYHNFRLKLPIYQWLYSQGQITLYL